MCFGGSEMVFDPPDTAAVVLNEPQNAEKQPSSGSALVRPCKLPLANSLHMPVMSFDRDSMLIIDRDCARRLERFQAKTVLSIGTPRGASVYQGLTLQFALQVSATWLPLVQSFQ